MAKAEIVMVPQIVIPPKDQNNCEHTWSYYTYGINGIITSKRLCFYCKKVEECK